MKGFFQENSKLSMTRLLSLLTCLSGLTIGIIAAYKGNANGSIVSIALGFVYGALGLKFAQKTKEEK